MNVTTLAVSKAEAETMYREYRDAQKTHDEAYVRDIRVLAGHMRHGRVVLDVYQAAREAGLNERFDPRIAICRADYRKAFFEKFLDNTSRFTGHENWDWHGEPTGTARRSRVGQHGAYVDDTFFPVGTYAAWPRDERRDIIRQVLVTTVPTIPPRFLPRNALSNYYLLWEPEKWDAVTPPRDPMLLKRVSPNMFVVLAAWELTEIERAVLRGRIA